MVLKDTIANSIISLEEAISNMQPGGLISPNSGSIVTIEDVAEPGIGGEINLTTGIDEGLEHNPSTKISLTSIRPSAGGPTWSEFSVSLKPYAQENPYVRFLMQASAGSSATVYAGISGTPLDVEEPIAPTNAATKGYVDNFVPDRIKGGAGTTYDETEIGVGPDATGHPSKLLRGVNRGDVFLEQYARENSAGIGHIGWRNARTGYGRGYVEWSSSYALIFGSHSAGNYGRVYVDGINGGNVYFDIPGASAGGGYETSKGLRLGSHINRTPNVRALPSHVNSILHGIKLGVDAHDELANYDWSEYPAVQDVDLNTFKITNLVDPTNPQDAATKAYVDSHSGGGGDSSLLTSNDANTFITASNDSLITGFDQYSKKLTVEELDPEAPGLMLSKSIETWDDIASDQTIWGSADGFGKAFMRTNYAFVEDSNNKSWGFQWINNVFEGHSNHGFNISQGDHRLTFATVDTSSGDFYLASETFAEDYWSRVDIRKDNIEIRAARDYTTEETSFKIDPSGSFTNKPLDMGNNRITNVEDPTNPQDVATKAYVDSQSGGGGGSTPGHVICNVIEDDPPIEPVPQRKNLVFFSDAGKVEVQDFEELDTTIVDLSGILEGVDAILSRASDDPNNKTYARASVYSSYASGESNANFSIRLYDHNSRESYLQLERAPLGERFVVGLGHQPGDLVFEVNDHTFYGDKEFRLRGAPTLIETPVKPDHAATKGYVDASRSDLEWWTPSWTPIENVGSVSNVECSYTRTYRAAGGSLVTLEGTIEVTPVAGDARSTASAVLPIPRVGTDIVGGVATYTDYDGDDFGIARVGIADLGAGHQFTVQYTPNTNAVHRVSFRVSYRAA